MLGLLFGAVGLIGAALSPSVPLLLVALVPLALGIGLGHPTVSSLISQVAREDEQGRVQGAASAVESLGRTVGPVWGHASLQRLGETTPYISAGLFLMLTLALTVGYHVAEPDAEALSSNRSDCK
jgi:DHA1 family tetracycline resistance protein-like MFS transporter